jgi:hypothetical protein
MLTFEVPLVRIRYGKCVGFSEKEREPPLPRPIRVNLAAKDLAMGHRIVRAVESGEVRDYTEAARRLGVSQARVSMLVAITFLAPDLQELILSSWPMDRRLNIHHLLIPARIMKWVQQRRFFRDQASSPNA